MLHATNPQILDIVESLIEPDIKLFGSQCFMKPPGGIEKPYHQDSACFAIEPRELVTCWTALDDATIDNGCQWVVPGSHQIGLLDHDQPWHVGDRVDMQVRDEQIDYTREVSNELKAGSCSFHHSMLLHRSGPNQTQSSRRGLAVTTCRRDCGGRIPHRNNQHMCCYGDANTKVVFSVRCFVTVLSVLFVLDHQRVSKRCGHCGGDGRRRFGSVACASTVIHILPSERQP